MLTNDLQCVLSNLDISENFICARVSIYGCSAYALYVEAALFLCYDVQRTSIRVYSVKEFFW